MLEPEAVTAIVRLGQSGWGAKRIARTLGIARNTVRRYLNAGGPVAYRQPRRASVLGGHQAWLRERFLQHRGNCDVVRQQLSKELGIDTSLRTVERACRGFRQELEASRRATIRFETAPGEQMQIDFGQTRVLIGGESVRVFLFVATLGYSRRGFVCAFRHERQSAWFAGIEAAFAHFGGRAQTLLIDNAKALVDQHNAQTRQVRLNSRFEAFCRHWDIRAKACAPFRARTKGKTENGVGYVKKNAIAGHAFESWAAMEAHLARWQREVADVRIHGTTGVTPAERFDLEREHLRPVAGVAPFLQVRELARRVNAEGCIELDTNAYSVPWRLIGETVTVVVSADTVAVEYAGQEVARHAELSGSRGRSIERSHLLGGSPPVEHEPAPPSTDALLRPLAEYEALIGGSW
ncbi:MAG: IS21 family transposase [Methyloversatilis sp.]|jgi:transposase|uniref:IS21 family transposase n=1 Tax=Methyloversatilis sp. TaxID=2569862 RepID=UPI0025FC0C4D|nr:IS21 family transposase [Methyloversatilis sp.]MCR6665774.1 IS21 family transposase [Methyloversatilis sp.]MCR6666652.1 IS21 family transposase [Methyloversatilis sp.]MCR6667622.1 IS21 family transposase [Methyloversatilis sp.]MCR6667811.1 IS21 family transposase [Methyloversatilis sp.]